MLSKIKSEITDIDRGNNNEIFEVPIWDYYRV